MNYTLCLLYISMFDAPSIRNILFISALKESNTANAKNHSANAVKGYLLIKILIIYSLCPL